MATLLSQLDSLWLTYDIYHLLIQALNQLTAMAIPLCSLFLNVTCSLKFIMKNQTSYASQPWLIIIHYLLSTMSIILKNV